MKTYLNEEEFVKNFAKDAKSELKSNGTFEAVVNDINVIVTGMDNNNASKVTMYSGSVNGETFNGSITALKKKVNVTYKKEYNRSSEPSTKIVIKSDEELEATARTADERIKAAIQTINKYANQFAIMFDVLVADGYEETDENGNTFGVTAYDMILAELKRKRDDAKQRAEENAKKKAEESAKREAKKQQLLEALSAASAKGDMSEIMRLSKELKSYM